MRFLALCDTCRHQHAIDFDPRIGPGAAFADWVTKHAGHEVNFIWPQRSPKKVPDFNPILPQNPYQDYLHNANIKTAFAASAALTITLASLASDTNLLAGRQSTVIDNSSNLYVDYLLGVNKITSGTTPTAGVLEVWLFSSMDDTPNWPDTLGAADANVTLTSANIKNAGLKPFGSVVNSTSSNVAYPFSPACVGGLFGGPLRKWGVFVVHSMVAALNATGGNHVLSQTGIYLTSI